jgi:hypothetical protein
LPNDCGGRIVSGYDLSGYIDVAERIRLAKEMYPEFSLQCEWSFIEMPDGSIGISAKAYAYRTPDDIRPGIGNIIEPYPGRTPYTKGSEIANAESSAWGRALVAIGIGAQRIASADEVRLARERQGETQGTPTPYVSPVTHGGTPKQMEFLGKLLKAAGATNNDESMVIVRGILPDLPETTKQVRQLTGAQVSKVIENLKGA